MLGNPKVCQPSPTTARFVPVQLRISPLLPYDNSVVPCDLSTPLVKIWKACLILPNIAISNLSGL